MDKLEFETPDMVSENIDKIAALFPSAITEMRGEDGKIKRGVNFEVLKQLLSRDVVDGDECYEFTWVGKKAAMAEAARPITKTLRPVKADSRDWDTTENLYIEGDNLEVLKILQESYLGKVKMIYIDPPYNTGNDFIYADDFMRSQEEENEQMGMYDEDENRLFKNADTRGRFHSDWCSMIYSRLMLARNLLIDDGVIFISIDVNEQHNLRKICDEVFGAGNFIMDFIWNSRKSVSNDAVVSLNHNYTLVYTKAITSFYLRKATFKLPDSGDGFDNPDNDPRGPWKADPFDSPGIRTNLTYKIVNPNTGMEFWPPEGRCWRTGEKEYLQFVADGRIVYGKTGNGKPQLKRFYSEAQEKGIRESVTCKQKKTCVIAPRSYADFLRYIRALRLMEAYSPLGTGRILQLEEMRYFAEKYNHSIAQICIRWSLQMGFIPLPKSINASRIRENINVFDFKLSDEDVSTIASIQAGSVARDPDTINF